MLGVGVPWQWAERDSEYYDRAWRNLGQPAWYSWKWDAMGRPGFMPMAWCPRLGSDYTRVLQAAHRAPVRSVWLLGNEPERADQSDVSSDEFADAVRVWLALIGRRWAGPGILWGDEGRWWLDEYIKLGGPLPDIWAIHIYGSLDVAGWLDQLFHARRWFAEMRATRPIWVTETNGSEALMRFLAAEPSLTAYWYCARDPFGHNAAYDLLDAEGKPTHLGRVFRSLQTGPEGAGSGTHRQYLPMIF